MYEDIIIIGAGPKAAAVALRADALSKAGYDAPRVRIIEKARIGQNWRRGGGWTDGQQSLGTSPFKDLGYPYGEIGNPIDEDVQPHLISRSWLSYLVQNHKYGTWVDRGCPNPTHKEWADYVSWVILSTSADIIYAEVTGIELYETTQVKVSLSDGRELLSRALMITGLGESREQISSQCLTMFDFWATKSKDERFFGKRIALIGGGETSAAIARCLVERTIPAQLTVISPLETIYSRGESFLENHYYTNPHGWHSLSETQRRDFILRTDRAVYSQGVQSVLTARGAHSHVKGRVVEVLPTLDASRAVIKHEQGEQSIEADYIIDARGGNQLWFEPLLGEKLRSLVRDVSGGKISVSGLEVNIQHDLSLRDVGFSFYIPNLSALTQGPGFPNLSSLGLLASRILHG